MNDPKKFRLPDRNPATHAIHRREVFWQITFPLVVVVVLLLALAGGVVWSAANQGENLGRWAGVSLMWLMPPVFLFAFLFLVFLAGITYGIIRLIQVLPGVTRLIHIYLQLIQARLNQFADLAIEPFLKTHSTAAGLKALKRYFIK